MSERPHWLLQDGLIRSAERAPDGVAVVAEGRERTYAELADASLRFARGLQDLGLQRGDRVVIQLENSWRAAVAILGTALAGGVFVPINAQTKEDKRRQVLDDSEASVFVAESVIAAAVPETPALRVVSTGDTDGVLGFDELVELASPDPATPATIPVDLATLIYTSGTTGAPKGVMITHRNMVFATESVATYLEVGPRDRILGVLPFAVSYGLYQLVLAAHVGASVLLERSFAFPRDVLQRVGDADVTVFPAVPTIFAALLAQSPRPTFPAVTCVTNAGAALPPGFVAGIRECFPSARLYSMYGQTECKRVSYLDPELVDGKPLSVGRAIPGTEAFVLRDDGERAGPGEVGILHVRGPHVMAGYWRQPELTAKALVPAPLPGELMLRTGDLFRTDREGLLYFVSRTDDLIMSGGNKVSPVEIENTVYTFPGVREVAAVGVPDAILGEAVVVWVATHEGAELTPEEIRRACRARLEPALVPKRVILVEELPKTLAGKISRAELRAEAIASAGA